MISNFALLIRLGCTEKTIHEEESTNAEARDSMAQLKVESASVP